MGISKLVRFNCDALSIVLIIRLSILSSCFPVIGSLSLKPPAEELLNKHLCPDPVLHNQNTPAIFSSTSSSNKILPVSLQRSKSKDRANTYFSRFRPCSFIEDPGTLLSSFLAQDGTSNATQVRITSINLSFEPWNFTNSTECSKFIMFRPWGQYGNGHAVMCGRDNIDQYIGPIGHPIILYYHLKDQGISFPLFHPNYGQNYNYNREQDILELKYLLIYFTWKRADGDWGCRVQQYLLDPLQQGCPSSYQNQVICGDYKCSDLAPLYQRKMGISSDGDLHQQRFIIVKKTQEKYRVRNFLRQKFVPIVFLLVLIFAYKSYMRAGLRLSEPLPLPVSEMRLRRYHHRHHLRPYLSESGSTDHFRDIYFEFGETDPVPGLHIPYDPSNGGVSPVETPDPRQLGKYGTHGTGSDPPPSYDSLFPPTYSEAVTSSSVKHPKA